MKIFRILALGGCIAAALVVARPSQGIEWRARRTDAAAASNNWHQYYYDPAWGMPLALVVPPTARAQTHYGWGVGNMRVTPIYNKFSPGWQPPMSEYHRGSFQATPAQPTDTDQFGVYYVRGPW